MKKLAIACLALALGACAAPSPHAPEPAHDAGVRIERIDKAFDLDAGVARVAIDNPWGEINVRGRDEREIGIHAVVQRMAPDFAAVKIASHREGDTLHIGVSFAGAADPGARAGRADLAVYLPGDLPLALSTRDGRIDAKRRPGAVQATTDSGEIRAASLGRLELRSRSGQIRAVAIGKRWAGASELITDTGRIVLLVPTFGDVALEAETGGKLSSAFGLSVHEMPGGRREAHAKYGAGTSILRARSTSGEIVLDQLVLLGDDKSLPEDDD